jgi:hypothetical protein
MSCLLAKYPGLRVSDRRERFLDTFYQLLNDREFNDAITYSPNDTKKVKRRFEIAKARFEEVFDA